MANDSNTIKPFSEGLATVKQVDYPWKEYMTDEATNRIITVSYPDGSKKETTYNPFKEEFRKALNRILPLT